MAPARSHWITDAPPRTRVAVRGAVRELRATCSAERRLLEVSLSDGTGRLDLVFLGRDHLGGVVPGRGMTAAGVVATRRGRPVVFNPWYWLHVDQEADNHA